jgi:alkylation response protein AidB-like acyl-CoA dehydrogenase
VSDPPAGFDDRVAQVADDVLFAQALEVDARSEIPAGHLGALADAGLFAVAGPVEHGGLDLDARRQRRVRETLAAGCLTTAFVWAQHQSVVRRLRDGAAAPREAWLADLCAGRRLGGIVLAGLLPGPACLAI